MQFTYILTIVSTLGLAQAQLPNLPDCSLGCFLSALENDGCSGLTNFTCHCAVPTLVSAITPCVQSACNLADQSSVSNAVTSVCSSVSVPISIPPVTATTTTTTTTTGSAAATTSSGSGSTTPSRTSCSGKSTSASSSGIGGASSTSGSSSSSGASASASSSTSTSTGTETTSTHTTTRSTTTSVPQASGAADSISAPFVGTGLFAMGVAALFAL